MVLLAGELMPAKFFELRHSDEISSFHNNNLKTILIFY